MPSRGEVSQSTGGCSSADERPPRSISDEQGRRCDVYCCNGGSGVVENMGAGGWLGSKSTRQLLLHLPHVHSFQAPAFDLPFLATTRFSTTARTETCQPLILQLFERFSLPVSTRRARRLPFTRRPQPQLTPSNAGRLSLLNQPFIRGRRGCKLFSCVFHLSQSRLLTATPPYRQSKPLGRTLSPYKLLVLVA